MTVNGSIQGNAQTRGEALLSGDGKHNVFHITFAKAFSVKPIVLITTNQFARSRLVSIGCERLYRGIRRSAESRQEQYYRLVDGAGVITAITLGSQASRLPANLPGRFALNRLTTANLRGDSRAGGTPNTF